MLCLENGDIMIYLSAYNYVRVMCLKELSENPCFWAFSASCWLLSTVHKNGKSETEMEANKNPFEWKSWTFHIRRVHTLISELLHSTLHDWDLASIATVSQWWGHVLFLQRKLCGRSTLSWRSSQVKPRLTTVNGKNRVEVEKDQRLQTDAIDTVN